MKKTILITLGIVTILIVVGVWVYLFIYGAPKSADEVFSNFGFGGEESSEFPIDSEPSVVDTAPVTQEGVTQALRQLTTRPVAGATFIDGGIRYVERGTGHMYDIMFSTGTESLIVGTTIPKAVEAVFREGGEQVAVTYEIDNTEQVIVGTLSTNGGERTLEVLNLPVGAEGPTFTPGQTISYVEKGNDGSTGVTYNTTSGTSTVRFAIPLRDIEVIWGEDIYVYTTPSWQQFGYVYKIGKGNQLQYVTEGGFGLVALPLRNGIVVSKNIDSSFESRSLSGSSTQLFAVSLLREKCVVNPTAVNSLYCAAPSTKLVGEYPDIWYKGTVAFEDTLLTVDATGAGTSLLADFLSQSGRKIDVSHIGTNAVGTYIYFINKNDGTLWMYDTTLTPQGGEGV